MLQHHPFRSKDYQLYCHLAEQRATIQRVQLNMGKRWIAAQNRTLHEGVKRANNSVEFRYNLILSKAKRLLTGTSPIFERNYRHDNTESSLRMHAFLCEGFYIELECKFNYHYQVLYSFNNCPYEHELLALLKVFPLDERAKEVTHKPDFKTFYKNVLTVQDKKYITY